MSGRTPTLGVNATLHAKPEQAQTVRDFLAGGRAIVDEEPDTLQWFAYKAEDAPDGTPGAFGIFDTFPSSEGRDAHVNGRIPAALIPRVDELLSAPPALDPVDVIASKITGNAASEGTLAAGAIGFFYAKEDSVALVKELLTGPYAAAIHDEKYTHYWYAFQKDEKTFGVFAAWATEKERADHIAGPAVALLVSGSSPLITKPFQPQMLSMIAQKTHG